MRHCFANWDPVACHLPQRPHGPGELSPPFVKPQPWKGQTGSPVQPESLEEDGLGLTVAGSWGQSRRCPLWGPLVLPSSCLLAVQLLAPGRLGCLARWPAQSG